MDQYLLLKVLFVYCTFKRGVLALDYASALKYFQILKKSMMYSDQSILTMIRLVYEFEVLYNL